LSGVPKRAIGLCCPAKSHAAHRSVNRDSSTSTVSCCVATNAARPFVPQGCHRIHAHRAHASSQVRDRQEQWFQHELRKDFWIAFQLRATRKLGGHSTRRRKGHVYSAAQTCYALTRRALPPCHLSIGVAEELDCHLANGNSVNAQHTVAVQRLVLSDRLLQLTLMQSHVLSSPFPLCDQPVPSPSRPACCPPPPSPG
jgi:hypothetical protein